MLKTLHIMLSKVVGKVIHKSGKEGLSKETEDKCSLHPQWIKV